jgi:uncharacterized protein (TIGR03067 family)
MAAAEAPKASQHDWPHWQGPARDGMWRESGILARFPPGGPKVLWRMPVGGGYSGPAVAGDRLYVMDRLRAKDASGKPLRPTRAGIPGNERVLCLDAGSGKLIWKHEYDCPYKISFPAGPRTTPAVDDDRVYTLGAMGDVRCLDAASGNLRWSKNLIQEYHTDPPVWGWANHLLVDGNLVFCLVGGKGSAVVAFDKKTGKEKWKALDTEEIAYSPPTLFEAAGKRQLVIWVSESVNSLDPTTGRLNWTQPYPVGIRPQRPAANIATVRQDGDRLFISSYYHGPMMLQLTAAQPGVKVLWKGKSNDPLKPDGLHAAICTPTIRDGYIYGVCAYGELRCIRADNGKQMWETMAATTGGKKYDCANAFLIPQGDRFVIFNDHGDLILANLKPTGYEEIDRAHVLEPLGTGRGHRVVLCHPAFAHRSVFVRNDEELICISMADQSSARNSATKAIGSLVAVSCLGLEAGAPPSAHVGDMERMQGDWQCVALTYEGEVLADDEAQAFFRTVKGSEFTMFQFDKPRSKGSFEINEKQRPKQIDETSARSGGKASQGIYEFDGERLRICLAAPGAPRPKGFSSKPGSQTSLIVWERVRK